MTKWGVPPVGALLEAGDGPHNIVWDGDTVVLADHDESDDVLDALGSPSCDCYAAAAGWSASHTGLRHPGTRRDRTLPPRKVDQSADPASSKKPRDFRHHRVKDPFLAVLPLLAPEFRTALPSWVIPLNLWMIDLCER